MAEGMKFAHTISLAQGILNTSLQDGRIRLIQIPVKSMSHTRLGMTLCGDERLRMTPKIDTVISGRGS